MLKPLFCNDMHTRHIRHKKASLTKTHETFLNIYGIVINQLYK
jgi:hypothetical protein